MQADPRARLRALVRATGLSKSDFALIVLTGRGESTLYEWLRGETDTRLADWLPHVLSLTRDGEALVLRLHAPLRKRGRPPTAPRTRGTRSTRPRASGRTERT